MASASLDSYAYCPCDQTLEITFRSGSIYRFFLVSEAAAEAFERAESKGRHFNVAIRDRFPFAEIPPPEPPDLSEVLMRSIEAGRK